MAVAVLENGLNHAATPASALPGAAKKGLSLRLAPPEEWSRSS